MRIHQILLAVCPLALASVPALAEDAMKPMEGASMQMMKGGEVLAVMPDGHMGTMTLSDDAMMSDMTKMASPMDHCMMFVTGSDGKTMMVDTSTDAAMQECEKIAK